MSTTTTVLEVTGMHCPACSMLITMELQDLPGVSAVDCSHHTGDTSVTFDPTAITIDAITETVRRAGYGVASAR